jgi:hypothetical protein
MKYAFYKIVKVKKLERKLFFEAFYISFIVRVKLFFSPFRKIAEKLGEKGKLSMNNLQINDVLLVEIIHAIKRSVKYSVWRNKCLEQAITVKIMLSRRNISSTIFFGVKKAEDELKAHAWLKIGETFVVGERQHEKYTIVAFYT